MTWEQASDLGPDMVVGSYRIVKAIGRGGMGSVYEAIHTVLRRRAAIKVMHGELRQQPGMATRMVQEAAILDDIRHPGIVRVYECNLLPDHRPWIAMELVDGDTLSSRLARCSTLDPIEVATLLSQVGDVLAAVHSRGIVHRDLKPDNLLLTPGDRDFALRVIDWGVARLGPIGRLTLEGLTPGTPIYMSPEQATGKNIAAPCDIYSLGVIAYEALTGHPPFDGRTLAEVVCMHLSSEPRPLAELCNAPRELCQLVHRMLEKDPSVRPGAIEVRQIARAIASVGSAYEEFEVNGLVRSPNHPAPHAPTPEVVDDAWLIDPDALEYGVTQLVPVPVVRKPRWTPEFGQAVPNALVAQASHEWGGPRSPQEQIAGEIILLDKRR